MKKVYKITGIDCANCAAKIERNINNIPGVEDATITFATEQLRLTAEDPDALIPAILAVARDEEPEAEITPLESKPQAAAGAKKKDTDLIAILTGTGLCVVGLFLKWLNLLCCSTVSANILRKRPWPGAAARSWKPWTCGRKWSPWKRAP